MHKHIRFWLLLLASLWFAAGAWAQSYYVDITNRTGFVITHIYISPADSSSWEADVLGNKVLARDATQRVTLNGYAQSQERVAELLRNVSGASSWLERPNLTEVRVATLGQGKTTGRRVVEFQMDVAIKRPREQEAGAEGAKPGAGAQQLAKAAGTP